MSESDPAANKPLTPASSGSGSGSAGSWLLGLTALLALAAAGAFFVLRSQTGPAPAPVAEASERRERPAESLPSPERRTRASSATVPEAALAAKGHLVIRAAIEGADVLLDGRRVGTTPHEEPDLAPGIYTVRVEKDGYRPYERNVQVAARRHVIEAALVSSATRLHVDANVTATVILDGESRGTTPLTIDGVPAGTHDLTVTAVGYRPHRERLDLTGGRRQVTADLVSPLARLDETVSVKHKHRLGSCEGALRATASGIEYLSEHEDAFHVELERIETFAYDDDLSLDVEGGRNYDFESTDASPDALARFYERVREAVEVSRPRSQ